MHLAVKEDIPLDPADVGILGAAAVVARADRRADSIEETRLTAEALAERIGETLGSDDDSL